MSGSVTRVRGPRRWAPGAACAITAALVIHVTGASASPSNRSGDLRSARRFITILRGFYETTLRQRRTATEDVNGYIGVIQRTCPHVIPAESSEGSKRQRAVGQQMDLEETFDLWIVINGPIQPAEEREAVALHRLRFGDPRANRDAAAVARGQHLTAALEGSDLCKDLRAAKADRYHHVPAGTLRFLAFADRNLGVAEPSIAKVGKDLAADLPTRADQANVRRVRALQTRYLEFFADLFFRAAFNLSLVLAPPTTPQDGQAATTTAARTRSTSSSNEIPAASAASGRRLVSVSPGMGLTSSTNRSSLEASSIRSTRAKPAHPSRPYVSSAISPARMATVSSIWAGQTKRVRPIS